MPAISTSNANKVCRRLTFCDVDPEYGPAHKKRGVYIEFSNELSSKDTSKITSADSFQSNIEKISQKPKFSIISICKNYDKSSSNHSLYSPVSTVNYLPSIVQLDSLPAKFKKGELLGCVKDLGNGCDCSSCRFIKVLSSVKFGKLCNFVYDKIAFSALAKEFWKVSFRLPPRELIQKMIGFQWNNFSFLAWEESFYKKGINLQSTICDGGKNSHVLLHSRPPAERLMLSASEDNSPSFSGNNGKFRLTRQAKKTKKIREQDFHQQIFELLGDGSKLCYRSHGKEVLEGYKFGKNILCSCCNVMLSASKFEAHAGYEKKRKPYHSIYTSYGKSLHQIAMLLLVDKNSLDPSNNDLIVMRKNGEQNYSPCSSFSTPLRLRRIFQSPHDFVSCMICKDGDATLNFGNICSSTMLFCGQCSRMFHVGCLRLHGICDVKERPKPFDIWLCGDKCEKVCADLLDFVHGGPMMIPESQLNSLHCSIGSTLHEETEIDVHWQLLSGRFQGDECRSLLQMATAIFQEEFSAVYKGHRDVLSTMVNGEKGVAEFFGGMLCAVVTVKSVIVSAALLRVFGDHVAELLLAVTREERRGEGFFKILFLKIEEMLSFMKVGSLILPADDHSLPMWVNKFGFIKLSTEEIEEYQMKHRIVVFENTTMLKKVVLHP